jgi:DNA-binding transcriptional ArsR family regulator
MSAVWKLDLEPTRKFVLLALADRADDEGVCWPGVASLTRKTGLSERTVRKCLLVLNETGHLVVQKQPGFTNTYRVACGEIDPCTTRTPARRAPLREMQGGGAPAAPNTSYIHQSESNDSDSSPKTTSNYPAAFLKWWEAYPNKVGKGDASKKWIAARKRLGGDKAAEAHLQVTVECYAALPLPPDRQPPNPATWLNQARYEDPANQPGATNHDRKPASAAAATGRKQYLDPLAAAANADMGRGW